MVRNQAFLSVSLLDPSTNLVSMECFSGRQLDSAINCLHRFTVLQKKDPTVALSASDHCVLHPQVKLELFCKQCGMDMCRECTTTKHRSHECVVSSDVFHEEVRKLEKATGNVVDILEEVKQAISGVKEMRQRVRNRRDCNVNVTREMFAILRQAIDEKEEQTIVDIKEGANYTEKALEVSCTVGSV